MARADLFRHQLFLPRSLSGQLEALARGPGASRSRILTDALAAFFSRKGADELESRFIGRLDGLANQPARIERNGQIAQAIGRDRFQASVERVGLALANGRPSLVPEEG